MKRLAAGQEKRLISQSRRVEGEGSVLLTIIFLEDITCSGFAVRFISSKATSVLNFSVKLCLFIKRVIKGTYFLLFCSVMFQSDVVTSDSLAA